MKKEELEPGRVYVNPKTGKVFVFQKFGEESGAPVFYKIGKGPSENFGLPEHYVLKLEKLSWRHVMKLGQGSVECCKCKYPLSKEQVVTLGMDAAVGDTLSSGRTINERVESFTNYYCFSCYDELVEAGEIEVQ